MDKLQVFGFEGKDVRIVDRDGNPWFIARDVADILGYSDTQAMTRRIDEEDRNTCTDNSSGQGRSISIINESGLYCSILGSKKEEASRFKRWVTSEVLPSIRKNGGYLSPAVDFSDPDNVQSLLDAWKADRKRLEEAKAKIAIDAPKVEFYEQVTDSTDAIDIGEAAKVLNMGIGRNKLFEILRGYKILMPNNQPYQKYIDAGYFRTIESHYNDAKGDTHIYIKTVVFQRGLDYIRRVVDAYNTRNGN